MLRWVSTGMHPRKGRGGFLRVSAFISLLGEGVILPIFRTPSPQLDNMPLKSGIILPLKKRELISDMGSINSRGS